ncbi:glycosyltransferase family 2 protein [Hymenobacter actinosclerus]|uniref:glycosyltransferase family 2 protein n=1 Tax=Hymenobacter actinosclerus TaxID=82805 RepID=UPI0015A60983|nr:glycosyltransferase family 2 protein [Hymenobacter actinosclerus]
MSVIVPCYNYGHFLPETIASLQQQTYPHWECIVVDDGSKDNTREVCAELCAQDARIRYIHQDNGGPSMARNTGLRAAKGQYIQFLDADDLLPERKLERNVRFLENHQEVDLVYGKVRYFRHGANSRFSDSIDMQDKAWMPQVAGKGSEVLQEVVKGNIMVVHAPMLRQQLVQRVGEFDNELMACEDWEYWIRCAASDARFFYDHHDDVNALVRVHPVSAVNDNARMIHWGILMRVKISKLPAVAYCKPIRELNMQRLFLLISQEDFLNLYKGSWLTGARGLTNKMIQWRHCKFFLVNGTYWFLRRFRNS